MSIASYVIEKKDENIPRKIIKHLKDHAGQLK